VKVLSSPHQCWRTENSLEIGKFQQTMETLKIITCYVLFKRVNVGII
jgi:hypothetical protein